MIDENYLGHSFIRNEDLYYGNFKCSKCNIIVLYRSAKDKYWYGRSELGKGDWKLLDISCDEEIIKYIIE